MKALLHCSSSGLSKCCFVSQTRDLITSVHRSHGVRQVARTVYEACDLRADYIMQWADNLRGGRVNVPLDVGGHYFFIDSVVGGCLAGRKLSVSPHCNNLS